MQSQSSAAFAAARACAAIIAPLLVFAGVAEYYLGHTLLSFFVLAPAVASTLLFVPDEVGVQMSPRWPIGFPVPLTAAALLLLGCGQWWLGSCALIVAMVCILIQQPIRRAGLAFVAVLPALLFLMSLALRTTRPRVAVACGMGGVTLALLALAALGLSKLKSSKSRGRLSTVLLLCMMRGAWSADHAAATKMLPRTHAHNDYEHARPLLDALDNGFASVEADVHLVNGQLLVAHARRAVQSSRTLESLYLAPLQVRVTRNHGTVYEQTSEPLQLLVDIKGNGAATWAAMQPLLQKYSGILTQFPDQHTSSPKAVTVLLTGGYPPLPVIASTRPRYAALDGHLENMSTTVPLELMPLVSISWEKTFAWRGGGDLEPAELTKLQRLVAAIHSQHRRVRFWGTPDSPECWKLLLDCGVDYLNTDNLAGVRKFLLPTGR